MTFVQALLAIGYRPIPLSGAPGQKVVDIAIQRTLVELGTATRTCMLVSNDGDFVEQARGLLDGRRRRGHRLHGVPQPGVPRRWSSSGLEFFDLEYDVTRLQRAAAASAHHPDRRVRPQPVPLGADQLVDEHTQTGTSSTAPTA